MPHSSCSKVSPWIENVILSYGTQEEGSSIRLKAHVIGTGHMSQSQAQGSDSPTGLLFLSDDVLRIPAILTPAAWEHVQNHEDRESFASMLNTTVGIRDCRLQFHMAAEQTKCRFFLSVGGLTTLSAGPDKDNTPCCTTLPSVRLKICQTWRAMQEQDIPESEASQSGFDLTELLGEWQLDCMQSAVEGVKERIMETRGRSSPLDCVGTRWDADRVRYKGESSFTVPLKCLQIPGEDALQPRVSNQVPDNEVPAASEATHRDPPQPTEATQASVDAEAWTIGELPVLQPEPNASQGSSLSAEENIQQDDVIVELADSSVRPLSNPWDLFAPPRATSSSSEASPLETTEFRPDLAGFDCGTQVPGDGLKRLEKAAESGKEEPSFLTPYQKAQGSSSDPVPAVSSTSVKASGSPNEPPATDELSTNAAQEHPPSDQESQNLELGTEEGKCRKAKRKRDEPPLPPEHREEDVLLSLSPCSWLCDTLASSRSSQEDDDHQRASGLRWASANTPRVHSDGTPFSYSYEVTGQNLVDLSQFKVTGSCLQWAIGYLLVPKQNDNRLDT